MSFHEAPKFAVRKAEMKVICAGLPKTGTKSVAAALRVLGYNAYDAPETYNFHNDAWADIFAGRREAMKAFGEMYSDVDAVVDLPTCCMWDTILEAYPQSKVILTVRSSEEKWLKSLKNQAAQIPEILIPFISCNLNLVLFYCWIMSSSMYKLWTNFKISAELSLGFFPNRFTPINEHISRSAYRRHTAYVESVCKQRGVKLLIFNLEEGWRPLCNFLDQPIPETEFPHLNKNAGVSRGELGDQIKVYADRVKGEVSARIRLAVLSFSTLLVVFLCVSWTW